jgi:hypothetical protein
MTFFDLVLLPLHLGVIGTGAAILAASAVGLGGSLIAANQNKKAIEGAVGAQKQVDIGKLVADSRVNAEENLRKSLQLEQQYLPGQAAAREAATQQFLRQIDPTGSYAQQREKAVADLLGFTAGGAMPTYKGSELFQSAADRILADLNLGGQLSADTQSAVVRGALQGAGGAGVLGSEAGRGLVARDLGLTSLQLQQARQNAALQAGQIQSQLGLQQAQQYLQALGLGVDATTGQLQQAGSLYNMVQGIPLPESGLTSSDIANVTVGQTNASNQAAMQAAGLRAANTSQTIGGITGALQQGLGLYATSQMLGGAKAPYNPQVPANIPAGTTSGGFLHV